MAQRRQRGGRMGESAAGALRPLATEADAALDPRARARADLARLGVSDEVRDELARRLETLARTLSPDAYDAALAGAVLAHGVHRESEQMLRRSLADLGEIQRLLGAFSQEMGKLDEALQILATYVKRMRARARSSERPRWLH